MFLSSFTLRNTFPFLTRSVQLIFPFLIQHHAILCSKCNTSRVYSLFLRRVCCRKVFFLFNADLAMAVLALISRVHLASFVIMLPKWLKYYTFSSCFSFFTICMANGWLEIVITLVSFTFISSPRLFPFLSLPILIQ